MAEMHINAPHLLTAVAVVVIQEVISTIILQLRIGCKKAAHDLHPQVWIQGGEKPVVGVGVRRGG